MSNSRLSTSECKSTVRRTDLPENHDELLMAAAMLMENCKSDPSISISDGIECLDRGGVVAEMGARILYLLTGRDGLGWHHAGYNGLPFHTDKQNWLDYLSRRGAG